MQVIAAGKFKYNGRDVRPRDVVEMTPEDYYGFARVGLARMPLPGEVEDAAPSPRGSYRRRDMHTAR